MSLLRLHLVAATEEAMSLFRKRPQPASPAAQDFPPEQYEPVLRSSICTGEKTACMRDRESGRLREVMLIRTDADLDTFCRMYGLEKNSIKTVY